MAVANENTGGELGDLATGIMKDMLPGVPTHVSVSAVAVTWNGKKYAHDLCQWIAKANVPGLETIVVDNNSTDGTPEFINRSIPM